MIESHELPRARQHPDQAAARDARLLFVVSVLAAASIFGWALTRPLDWLLVVVPDDTYYYLEIARHVINTGRSTFDGVNLTNGYHPGWMLVSVACASVIQEPVSLLRALLACAFAFHVAASLLLMMAVRRIATEPSAWIAGGLWVLNLLPMRLALQGMEASFYIFAMSLALLTYVALLDGRKRATNTDFVRLGFGLSLCFWGRTEALILAAVAILTIGLSLRSSGWLRPMALMSLAFLVGVLPWLAYSQATTGKLLQQSGAMKLLWGNQALPSFAERLWAGMLYLLGTWVSLPILGALDAEAHGWRGAVNVLVVLAVFALLLRGLGVGSTRRLAIIGLVLLGVTLATGSVYAWFFADRQFWYKAQPGYFLFLILFFGAAEFGSRLPGAVVRPVIVTLALVQLLVVVWQWRSLATYPWQEDVYYSQQRFESLVPVGERIGCFNAGIPGYFSRRTVINLDGLVNNSIGTHYRNRTVDEYLAKEQIHYVADEAYALTRSLRFMRRPPEMQVLASAPLTGSGSPTRYLWQLIPPRDSSGASAVRSTR